jgi:hypothetical protein
VEVDERKINADFSIRAIGHEYELKRNQIRKDRDLEFNRSEFESETKNIDEKVLRYRAFENIPKALANR